MKTQSLCFYQLEAKIILMLPAFESGADDYVTKPVKPRIFNSKVKAMLRRFLKDDIRRQYPLRGDGDQ